MKKILSILLLFLFGYSFSYSLVRPSGVQYFNEEGQLYVSGNATTNDSLRLNFEEFLGGIIISSEINVDGIWKRGEFGTAPETLYIGNSIRIGDAGTNLNVINKFFPNNDNRVAVIEYNASGNVNNLQNIVHQEVEYDLVLQPDESGTVTSNSYTFVFATTSQGNALTNCIRFGSIIPDFIDVSFWVDSISDDNLIFSRRFDSEGTLPGENFCLEYDRPIGFPLNRPIFVTVSSDTVFTIKTNAAQTLPYLTSTRQQITFEEVAVQERGASINFEYIDLEEQEVTPSVTTGSVFYHVTNNLQEYNGSEWNKIVVNNDSNDMTFGQFLIQPTLKRMQVGTTNGFEKITDVFGTGIMVSNENAGFYLHEDGRDDVYGIETRTSSKIVLRDGANRQYFTLQNNDNFDFDIASMNIGDGSKKEELNFIFPNGASEACELGFHETSYKNNSIVFRYNSDDNCMEVIDYSSGVERSTPLFVIQRDGNPHVAFGDYIEFLRETSAPATPASGARLWIDSGDGDFKIKFSNGTVKTIATN